MPRRRTQQHHHLLDSFHQLNTVHVFKESIRVLLLHPTHFHSISVFLFSPFSISLFISHVITRHFPHLTSSYKPLAGYGVPPLLFKLLARSSLRFTICFPSSVTFSLLGKAATVQAVADSYNGVVGIQGRRLFLRSGSAWLKLLCTSLWELLLVMCVWAIFAVSLTAIPIMLSAQGLCSQNTGFRLVLCSLGGPFCLAFAHLVVLGNLAKVISVLDTDCCGLKAFMEANVLIVKRQQTALAIGLLGNMGFAIVELLFEFRLRGGLSFWEVSLLVSMYSLMLVFDTVLNAVFYFACKF